MLFFETSAKKNINITEVFKLLTEKILIMEKEKEKNNLGNDL